MPVLATAAGMPVGSNKRARANSVAHKLDTRGTGISPRGASGRLSRDEQRALDDAYSRHPGRFVNDAPKAKAPPAIVSINPLPASVISLPGATGSNEIERLDT